MSAQDIKSQAQAILKPRAVFYMATVDHGIPRVRPMTCLHADGFKVWTCSHRDTAKIQQLKDNNTTELCFMDALNRIVRITGTVTVFEEEKDWAAIPIQKECMPMLEDPNYLLLVIEPTQVRFTNDWSLEHKTIPID